MKSKTENLELRGDIVIPGEDLGKNKRHGGFTFEDGDMIKSSVFGIKEDKKDYVSVISLSGRYLPKAGDMVVGIISRVGRTFWIININAAYESLLPVEKAVSRDRGYGRDRGRDRGGRDRGRDRRGGGFKRDREQITDLRALYKEGDIVSIKIDDVNEIRESYADGPRKLTGGRIVIVSAKKVPRIIGNKKSMLNLLRDKSGCRIVVGQNGIIWLDGDEEAMQLVVDAILKIERESHTRGLTNRISEFMDEGLKKLKKTEKAGKTAKKE